MQWEFKSLVSSLSVRKITSVYFNFKDFQSLGYIINQKEDCDQEARRTSRMKGATMKELKRFLRVILKRKLLETKTEIIVPYYSPLLCMDVKVR